MKDDKQTKLEFAAMLGAVMEGIYGRPALAKEALAMWFMALQRHDLDEVRAALSKHVADPDRGQFPPRPADIVRNIDGSNTGAAPLAWGKVLRAISQVGSYQSVVFDDPAIHAAIEDIGGWVELCTVKTEDVPFLQRRFEAAYRAHRERGTQDYPRQLAGRIAIDNGARGYDVPDPLLLGDAEAARLVHERGGTAALPVTPQTALGKALGAVLISLDKARKERAA